LLSLVSNGSSLQDNNMMCIGPMTSSKVTDQASINHFFLLDVSVSLLSFSL